MTASSSTVEATNAPLISIARYSNYRKRPNCLNKIEIEDICSSVWDELYQKDKFFRLYRPDYDGWRYTVYGDDLASVTSSINLCWLHEETSIPSPRKRTCLANFWQQEGYP
jgi:hypothetical protein